MAVGHADGLGSPRLARLAQQLVDRPASGRLIGAVVVVEQVDGQLVRTTWRYDYRYFSLVIRFGFRSFLSARELPIANIQDQDFLRFNRLCERFGPRFSLAI